MIPREILKKIRRIQIRSTRMVNDVLAGQYESVFKGRGMEFEEVRQYQPGDDVRAIDWNVTARTGEPHIKRFVEERELTVMLLVDASSSGRFGSAGQMKSELAAELCAVLAFSAIHNNDKVGLIIFTDQVEKFVPPKKGRSHVLRVIRDILYYEPKQSETDIAAALDYLNGVTTRRTVTFLVSDFLAAGYERALRVSNKRHDVIAMSIIDPREVAMPNVGLIELTDAETGESILVDTSSGALRGDYAAFSEGMLAERRSLFRSIGVDSIEIRTDEPYIRPLMRFFRMRERRLTVGIRA